MYEYLTIPFTLLLITYTYYKWCFQYWKNRNFYHLPGNVPFGSLENPITRKVPYYVRLKEFYDLSKSLGHKHAGLYLMWNPRYLPIHPDYVKDVMSNDFNHFVDRGMFHNSHDDPLSNNLFIMGGEKWRRLRAKLTPIFTTAKIRGMWEILMNVGDSLHEALDGCIARNEAIDIKDISGCYTTDVIGSVVFGYECNSFKDPNSPFRVLGKKVFTVYLHDILKFLFWNMFPSISKLLRFKLVRRDIHEFFMGTIKKTIAYRETNNVRRNDFLQITIDVKNNAPEHEILTVNEVAAQAFLFFAAGLDTSSTTMQYCLFEVAQNDAIQTRLREEILEVSRRHDGMLTYEAIHELKYLNMVIQETLRKYPILPVLQRTCTKEYKVPNSNIIIPKDMKVLIPSHALHHDAEFHPDPEKFDPERFSEKNMHLIKPYTFIPFGEGPRTCIGKRFGLIMSKVGVATILRNYIVKLHPKTVMPFELNRHNGLLYISKHTIYLDFKKL